MRNVSAVTLLASLTWMSGCAQPLVRFEQDAGPSCNAPQSACGSACVDLRFDDSNCGACAIACTATQSCAASRCYADDCPGTDCAANQVCVNGACTGRTCVEVTCQSGFTCFMGSCQAESCNGQMCPAGSVCVNNACTDVACIGVSCPAGQACVRGRCEGVDAGPQDAGSCSACPVPVNAPSRCSPTFQCSRGPCIPGFFDFETGIFGCETACRGANCNGSDGGAFVLTVPPVGESGAVGRTASSGSSYGSAVQTSSQYSNFGTLGEPTPPAPEQTGSAYRNRGGFKTQLERP